MQIEFSGSEAVVAPTDTRPERVTITIEFDSATEDPTGHLWGLLIADRLGDFLRLYGMGRDVFIGGEGDLWDLLVAAGKVQHRLTRSTAALMWAARDTYGKSWGEIASGLDMPRDSVRSMVERVRLDMAKQGYWRDQNGLHYESDPEVARGWALSRAGELSLRRSPRDTADDD